MSTDLKRPLYAVALFLLLVGVGFRLRPVDLDTPDVPPISWPEPAVEPSPNEQALALLGYQGIIEANVFSRDRQPPGERYVPPELATSEPASAPPPSIPRLRLFGVAVGPTGAVALIDADPAIPGAEVYRVGDVVRGLHVLEIDERAVVLQGTDGRVVLTLPSSGRRSP